MKSRAVFTGSDGWTTSTQGWPETKPIGVKSSNVRYESVLYVLGLDTCVAECTITV